jgi:hypothetical protein
MNSGCWRSWTGIAVKWRWCWSAVNARNGKNCRSNDWPSRWHLDGERAEDRLAENNVFLDEITGAQLETPEPHRNGIRKELLPLREKIQAIKPPED